MNGYDMMCNLVDYFGDGYVLDELTRYLPNDVVVDAMRHIAKMQDFDFEDEEE